jgi:hypothetical protein
MLVFTELLLVLGPTATPHTSQDLPVRRIRDLTGCSYVSLIVARRNITGRHPPGNAEASPAGQASPTDKTLLEQPTRILRGLRRYCRRIVDRKMRLAFAHLGQVLTPIRNQAFQALTGEITAQSWCGGMLSRNHSSWSESSTGESVSRSSLDIWGNSSPKILLTTLRDGLAVFITVRPRCDEDHIRRQIAVHLRVHNRAIVRLRRTQGIHHDARSAPYRHKASKRNRLDLQAG